MNVNLIMEFATTDASMKMEAFAVVVETVIPYTVTI
jgi:hypothetical protein